ncbi:MAG: glycosyl transferase family protein [Alphaproteobacteria bacterium]
MPQIEASMRVTHPFAEYVRTVARGATLSRPLTLDEAQAAMAMILDGRAEPSQVGAFLAVLRYRKETPEELAGFVKAARFVLPSGPLSADLDWPSYADRHRQLPYFTLAALLLASNGVRILMHGLAGEGPATTPKVLDALGAESSSSMDAAAASIAARNFAYLPIERLLPPLARLFDLRAILGVRTSTNTFARALNPSQAPAVMQGVFHPTYLPTHGELARILHQPRAAIFKGGGGEAQRNPEKLCRTVTLRDGTLTEEEWPAMTPRSAHPWREERRDPDEVVRLWRGERQDSAPEAAVVGTVAIALKLLGRASTMEAAEASAWAMWRGRDRVRMPLAG